LKIIAPILLLNLLFGFSPNNNTINSDNTSVDIPVLKLNFYLMGKSDIDQETILEIGDNMDYLNEEFEGSVKFELNKLFLDEKHEYLPNIYDEYKRKSRNNVIELIKDIEETGAINIYLLETYSVDNSNKSLMGFTPILTGMHRTYAYNSPRFDRMFLAYPALQEKSTLVHEMGHFLGLSHPWEMSSLDMELLGLDNTETLNRNHMTYNMNVDKFTPQQLNRMRDFAKRFRKYLLKPS